MKRFLTGVRWAIGPAGWGSLWKGLVVGALSFGVAPVAVQAQDPMSYGQTGTGQTEYGQSGTSQQAPLAAATLFGLPAEHGRVQWPLGLRLLPTDQTKALLGQLEVALYFVATQAGEGKVNPVFVDFGLEAVRDLRQLLRPYERTMSDITYTEAMRFLERAERGLTKIKTIQSSADGS